MGKHLLVYLLKSWTEYIEYIRYKSKFNIFLLIGLVLNTKESTAFAFWIDFISEIRQGKIIFGLISIQNFALLSVHTNSLTNLFSWNVIVDQVVHTMVFII